MFLTLHFKSEITPAFLPFRAAIFERVFDPTPEFDDSWGMRDERADLILALLGSIRRTLDEHGCKLDELITRLGALERDQRSLRVELYAQRCSWH
ncbi:MAG: hypothetical protein ACJ8AH_22290 [Stellaceae bacterium]